MSSYVIYGLSACCIFGLGMFSLMANHDLIRKIIGFNLAGSGIGLLIVSLAKGPGAVSVDAVSHTFVLTGLVISIAATALYLSIYVRLKQEVNHEHDPSAHHQ